MRAWILSQQPSIIMDEPTSALSDNEIDNLFKTVNKLKKKGHHSYISHRMEEIKYIGDRPAFCGTENI